MAELLLKLVVFCFLIGIGLCLETETSARTCSIRKRILNHGDHFEPRQCFVCTCRNGSLNCDTVDPKQCPELPCDAAVQVSTPDRCCKICPGTLARCRYNGMSVEDRERFQLNPHGSCVCQDGQLTCHTSPTDQPTEHTPTPKTPSHS